MLRPHDRKDAEFGEVRLAPQAAEDHLIFIGREAVLGNDLGRDGDVGHARPPSRCPCEREGGEAPFAPSHCCFSRPWFADATTAVRDMAAEAPKGELHMRHWWIGLTAVLVVAAAPAITRWPLQPASSAIGFSISGG